MTSRTATMTMTIEARDERLATREERAEAGWTLKDSHRHARVRGWVVFESLLRGGATLR